MGIFDRFPYSSTHEMNLDFMLGKATEIAEDMQRVTAGMEQVQAGLTAISEKTEQATQAAAQAAASASSIEGSVTAAEEAAEEAQMHNESAQTWANNALTYKADCQRAATEAAASSSSAAQAATAAAASEDTVAQYAQAANASAQSAANNNDSAHQYANQASASASNATFHSSNAQTAATNANTSATNAGAAADRAVAASNLADEAVEQAQTAANGAIASATAAETRINNLAASLPEDFTEINNDVTNLKSEWLTTKEPYKMPIKWRHGVININGATYLSTYGCITDYIIPTSLCDYITPLDTSYEIYIVYYNDSIGKPIFAIRTANINAVTNIDKTYPYFTIGIFKSWNEQIAIDQCDSIVSLYTGIILNAKGIFEKLYNNKAILNKTDIWSICHQGYNEDTLGHNRKGGYALAAARGFTHGECDIKLTSDNKVVCCHDNTFIDATSGATITISTSTLAELQACDYYGTTIATLGEIIAECKMYGIKLVIDQFSVSNVEYACNVISEYNAWNMCILTISYNNAQPESTSNMVEYIKANYNDNANFAILSNDFSNYSNALAYTKTLNNAIFYIGQYLTNNFETIKTIASGINGKCKLMIWTIDNLTDINNALPYINGYCSNAWSGNDVFNPVLNNGM